MTNVAVLGTDAIGSSTAADLVEAGIDAVLIDPGRRGDCEIKLVAELCCWRPRCDAIAIVNGGTRSP